MKTKKPINTNLKIKPLDPEILALRRSVSDYFGNLGLDPERVKAQTDAFTQIFTGKGGDSK